MYIKLVGNIVFLIFLGDDCNFQNWCFIYNGVRVVCCDLCIFVEGLGEVLKKLYKFRV